MSHELSFFQDWVKHYAVYFLTVLHHRNVSKFVEHQISEKAWSYSVCKIAILMEDTDIEI